MQRNYNYDNNVRMNDVDNKNDNKDKFDKRYYK